MKSFLYKVYNKISSYDAFNKRRNVNSLYHILYNLVHDLDNSLDISSKQTQSAFSKQWDTYKDGKGILSDEWFKANVCNILTEEEIQIKPEWFKGKEVLDGGCGNGRWAYGMAKLGANVTCVDINESALRETELALKDFNVNKTFIQSPLENLSENLGGKKFDMVFSWGVVHHCTSFNTSLRELTKHLKDDGILYLYLYGRESLPIEKDIKLFKQRVYYNSLDEKGKYKFLYKKALGNPANLHIMHDIFAPLLNRRLEFDYLDSFLKKEGFIDVVRTLDHPELFIRAIKNNKEDYYKNWFLPKKQKPFWFERYTV
jgi:2-polyprenyl-3-methyl-5-hydroxy-6-metoxy-1,4-benzoquinol methylase